MKFNTLQVMNTDEKTQSCDIVLPNKYCVVPENIHTPPTEGLFGLNPPPL